MLSITPLHELISKRFPVASFAISAPARRPFEIACATDLRLFSGGWRHLRNDGNFFTSRSRGWLLAPYGRAHYVVPASVVARFMPAWRLYYLLAAYDSVHAEQGMFSVAPAELGSAPYLRLSRDLAARAPGPASPAPARSDAGALTWGGDHVFSRALGDDGSDSGDGDFSVDGDGPAGTAPASADAKLVEGQVVTLEVRGGDGAVTHFSHDYPVDSDGNVRIPSAGRIAAKEKTLVELREALRRAFDGIVRGGSVNVTPSATTVSYADPVARSDTLYLRVLDPQGNLDPSSGAYVVDGDGKLHLPRLGDVDTADQTVGQLEATLEKAVGGARPGAVVSLSKTPLA